MLDFQQRWKVQSFFYSRWVRVFLLVFVLYGLFSTYTVYQKKRVSEIEVEKAEKIYLELSKKEAILQDHIDRLHTPEGLELEVRSKYSVARPDEHVVVFVDSEPDQVDPVTSTKESWIQRVFKWFSK